MCSLAQLWSLAECHASKNCLLFYSVKRPILPCSLSRFPKTNVHKAGHTKAIGSRETSRNRLKEHENNGRKTFLQAWHSARHTKRTNSYAYKKFVNLYSKLYLNLHIFSISLTFYIILP